MRDVIRKHNPTVLKITPIIIFRYYPVFEAVASELGYDRSMAASTARINTNTVASMPHYQDQGKAY